MDKIDPKSLDFDILVENFNQRLRSILDKHAPIKEKTVSQRPHCPWFNDNILQEKRNRRSAERLLHAKQTPENLAQYKRIKNRLNKLVERAKKDYYDRIINENDRNPKALFNAFNRLAGKPKSNQYPKAKNDEQIANNFASFFKEKIDKITKCFDTSGTPSRTSTGNEPNPPQMLRFTPLSEEEIERYIRKSPSTTCALDPIPTDILKHCLKELLPIITLLINRSLSTGIMPSAFKQALVIPLLKKPNADIEPKNFRPVSNLPFLSKVIERIVIDQMSAHCQLHNLNQALQSAYRCHHSTETALLKVTNDILQGFDRQNATIMALLDLSAAFDTVNHAIYIDRLSSDYGFEGAPLSWMSSYLSQRSQQVVVNGKRSESVHLSTGFPQGGGAGPWAYSRYTQPIARIIQLFSILYHFFADDTQLYKQFRTSNVRDQLSAKELLEKCIHGVSQWMQLNRLKLNMNKTECIIFGTKPQLSKLSFDTITVCNETITSVSSVRNLGVHLDQELKMAVHVSVVVKSAYYHIQKLRSVRRYLSRDAMKTLVQCFVISRLDYCNSLLYGIPEELLDKLQRVQNAAARLIYGLNKFDHVTDILKALHWLPIRYRIQYKIALITFKALRGDGPTYLVELLNPLGKHSRLRSSNKNLLKVPKSNLKYGGDRSFSVAAPRIWNSLPNEIKTYSTPLFKKSLKTHLFRTAYKC